MFSEKKRAICAAFSKSRMPGYSDAGVTEQVEHFGPWRCSVTMAPL